MIRTMMRWLSGGMMALATGLMFYLSGMGVNTSGMAVFIAIGWIAFIGAIAIEKGDKE